MDYPPTLPNHLKPKVAVAILRAKLQFPKPNQADKRIPATACAFAEIVCNAVEAKEWRADLALSALEWFLNGLCLCDDANTFPPASISFERFFEPIKKEITESKEWLKYLERLAEPAGGPSETRQGRTPAPKATSQAQRKAEREAIRDAHIERFPEKILILDVCWAAKQRYREWTRWTRGELKDGCKPDRAFRAVMNSEKRPEELRPDSRPKGWK